LAIRSVLRCLSVLLLFATLASCGTNEVKDSAPAGGVGRAGLPDDAVPRPEPRGRYGNGPVYEVFGQRYTVMDHASGYKERGIASWYGKKFHGRLTASREPYDMHAMTAAHKTLPLPTYVRVRNLRNNKSVIVRVNDRGPFVDNRIIDLSYSAALKLDMVRDGTSVVEVTAISFDSPTGDRPMRNTRSGAADASPTATQGNRIYVQVGAFGSRTNAHRSYSMLKTGGIDGALIHEDKSQGQVLYRVRIGPINGAAQYDALVERLAGLGIRNPILITQQE